MTEAERRVKMPKLEEKETVDSRRRAFNILIGALGAIHLYGWHALGNPKSELDGLSLSDALQIICNGGRSTERLIPLYLPEYKDMKAKLVVVKALEAVINTQDFMGWNDAPGRTEEEVLNVLAKAADSLV